MTALAKSFVAHKPIQFTEPISYLSIAIAWKQRSPSLIVFTKYLNHNEANTFLLVSYARWISSGMSVTGDKDTETVKKIERAKQVKNHLFLFSKATGLLVLVFWFKTVLGDDSV